MPKKKWTIKPKSYNPGKQYITRKGFEAMRDEYHELLNNKRPKLVKAVEEAAAHGDRSENAEYLYGKKLLRQTDGQIYRLQKKLENLDIVDESEFPKDHVGFGSTVKLLDLESDEEKIFQIVGESEIDTKSGKISYKSPLARALMGKRVGDEVLFRPPKGEVEYEILEIT